MSCISNSIRSFVHPIVRVLNQPPVKEGVKNIIGVVTLAFGIIVAGDAIRKLSIGRVSTASASTTAPMSSKEIADKIIINCAKISLILSAATSRLAVIALSKLVNTIFSSAQLERVFGPNTIFAVNPWHPRHVFSIAAVLLALPLIAQSIYRGMSRGAEPIETTTIWQINTKSVLIMLFITTVTSRPVLHLGNQLGQRFFSI